MANTGRVTQSIIIAGTLQEGEASVTQSIIIVASGLGLACGSPPVGQAQIPYSHIFPSGGGDPPVTFSITSGSVPPGLNLNASTGVLSGVPTGAGTFAFTVTVTDSLPFSVSVSCSITITGNVVIQLIGWKLYPDKPCESAVEGVEVTHVKRAV